MTSFTKTTVLIVGTALLTLAACSTASADGPKHEHQANAQNHQMMANGDKNGEHKGMMAQMKMDHDMMSKMDMSKMDMTKVSAECQTMMTKMKTKMANKHKDGGMHSDMKDHDMSKMGDHDMSKMKDHDMSKMAGHGKKGHDMKMTEGHDAEKMKAKMAKHKTCMAEMKEAMPHAH